MSELLFCDICGRSEKGFMQDNHTKFHLDEDDLWLCSKCRKTLITSPTNQVFEEELDDRIKKLIGKSAGAICRTTNLPFIPPYQTIIEAASLIAYDEDRYMSAWSLVTQWMDGTTIWQSQDKRKKAIVDTQGNIQIEEH